ncbi:MAG TPA: ACT domain-containing protein [Thermoanaerobaculia bacterium]|nr:ACT domain-containing protein [Thermoanaerobaculia bacterium]
MTEIPGWSVEEGTWAIARLAPSDPVPGWAASGPFVCIARTRDELSIVCPESAVPPGVRAERGWAMIKLAGPFPFDAVGVLEAVLAPLAHASVSVFAVSTFDTDYVLVKRDDLERAVGALEGARRAGGAAK